MHARIVRESALIIARLIVRRSLVSTLEAPVDDRSNVIIKIINDNNDATYYDAYCCVVIILIKTLLRTWRAVERVFGAIAPARNDRNREHGSRNSQHPSRIRVEYERRRRSIVFDH